MFYRVKMYVVLLAGIAFVAGCASAPKTVSVVPDDQKAEKVVMNEDFNPLTLNDYSLPAEKKSTVTTYKLEQFMKEDKVDSLNSDEMVPGYRVQLISTRYEAEARTVKLDAMLTFKENVYVIFDDPYYKIRIGDCLTRFDANVLQEEAADKNFNEAWVVRTNVFRSPVLQSEEGEDKEDIEVIVP